jgi:hypothetical protein
MSSKQVGQNSGGLSRKKGKKKRKAKSPLVDSGQTGSGTSSCKHPRNVNTDVEHSGSFIASQSSSYYTTFPDQTFMNLSMSNPQYQSNFAACPTPPVYNQNGYPAHQAQSPGFIPQQLQMVSSPQTGPPPWAQQLIQDMSELKSCISRIENIEKTVSKIDSIEKTVNTINLKVTAVEEKVKNLETKVVETEKSCAFISQESENQKRELHETKIEINHIHQSYKNLESNITDFERKNLELESKIVDQEIKSMRDNLIFYGIKEEQLNENCEELIQNVCSQHLQIDGTKLTFDRVHRLGPRVAGKTRPIIAKFHYYKEREEVRKKSYDNNDLLKRKDLGIGVQWPKQIREARKQLIPTLEREKAKGHSVKFVRDKLYVNGRQYVDDK